MHKRDSRSSEKNGSRKKFDNINQLELQAAIEAEIDLFGNSSSGHTYTTMQGFTLQPNLVWKL